jgi:ribosomal protein S18 acetylase RimI-like enzyme
MSDRRQIRISNTPGDADACTSIVRDLPEHFDDHALEQTPLDVRRHGAWLLEDAGRLVSFLVAERRGRVAEILWIATHPDAQRRGHGTHLLEHALARLQDEGVVLVEVKTLDASADYEPYEATRRFYERIGFVHLDTIDPYAAWEPGNPCAIYVAPLVRESRRSTFRRR